MAELRAHAARFRSLVDTSADAISVVGRDGRVLWQGGAAGSWLASSGPALLGATGSTVPVDTPSVDGLSELPLLRAECPSATVMIVSSTTTDGVVEQGLHRGAVAFFDKGGFIPRVPALMTEYRRLPHPQPMS